MRDSSATTNRLGPQLSFGLAALLVGLASCSGGGEGDLGNRGPFEPVLVTNGYGQIYPHRIAEVDGFGNPTTRIVNITSIDDLKANHTATNPVLPVGTWPDPGGSAPELPGSSGQGNQYLQVTFSHDLDVRSVLSDLGSSLTNSGLTNTLQVVAYDPATETTSTVVGRGFVGGKSYFDDPTTPSLDLQLVHAVQADGEGNVRIADSRATGFPIGFPGDEDLVRDNTFTFVPDADNDLSTFETFPKGQIIRVSATSAILDHRGKSLVRELHTGTVVGTDTSNPEVLGNLSSSAPLQVTPGNDQFGVDPAGAIRVSFSKPVQPRDVGEFFSIQNKTPEFRGIVLNAEVQDRNVQVLYYADPLSHSDFTTYVLSPAYVLLGQTRHQVQVSNSIRGLSASTTVGTPAATSFTTGDGPAMTNAPVAPEAIYVARSGSTPGVSVIDLNGFGQSTGDIKKFEDPSYRHGFKMNPNLGASGIVPPLESPKAGNLDAGSEGALTLTKNTNLSDLLLDESVVSNVGDIEVGQPLDKVFNNENINFLAGRANQINPLRGTPQWGNTITYAPMPNPPRLRFDPPPNPAFNIFAEEPAVATGLPVPCTSSVQSRLAQGNPFSTVVNSVGKFFQISQSYVGPQPVPGTPAPPMLNCPFNSRQQIGHFLYVLDRRNRQVLVVNSNRFQILETIRLPDPWEMAMSPNLQVLAVTNFGSNSVSFIDVDPGSPTLHQVIRETKVGQGPSALAWQPEGEDLLVVNSRSNSLSIIAGSDMSVRKTLINQINRPIDIAVTLRPINIGWNIQVYHAYILGADGGISIYESGPDGPNGIGFDDIVGSPDVARFRGATAIQPDITSFNSAIWITHQDPNGLGQVSHLEMTASPVGPAPVNQLQGGFILPPNFRDRTWSVNGRIGGSNPSNPNSPRLSGNSPVDIAFDDMRNVGGLGDFPSLFVSNLSYAQHSGKGHIKVTSNGTLVPAVNPQLMFVALADSGKIDVRNVNDGRLVRVIEAPGVTGLRSYWSQ